MTGRSRDAFRVQPVVAALLASLHRPGTVLAQSGHFLGQKRTIGVHALALLADLCIFRRGRHRNTKFPRQSVRVAMAPLAPRPEIKLSFEAG